jgi:hypothetical protein
MESMDDELRNSLWSTLQLFIWGKVYCRSYMFFNSNPEIHRLFVQLWLHHFKLPVDDLSDNWPVVITRLRQEFFSWEWHEVYDFVEFVANNYPFQDRDSFIEICNQYMERECSAYRFVNGVIVRITDEEEISAIELALKKAEGPVGTHLRRALGNLCTSSQPASYLNKL